MNKLSEIIEQATQDCLLTGNGDIRIDDQVTIQSTWEEWEEDNCFDVVTIYIYDCDIIKVRYQLEETKVNNDIPQYKKYPIKE